MTLSKEEFEATIRKRLRSNQFIVLLSIVIALTLFAVNQSNVYWSLLFLGIGSVCLVAINNCKSDRKDFNQERFLSAKGTLVDLFPEDERCRRWILFIHDETSDSIIELNTIKKPEVETNQTYQVCYTRKLNILVRIQ